MQYCYLESPIGRLLLCGQNGVLQLLGFPNAKRPVQPQSGWEHTTEPFKEWIKQLGEYFSGLRNNFDLPYEVQGTQFQQQVLKCVANVPYGQTTSYGAIAAKIKNPKAVRAVGTANATNKLPIIIPCHRIIGKNGTLTGFGGGLDVKQFLLNLERKHVHAII